MSFRLYQQEAFDFCRVTQAPYLNMDCGLGKTLVGIELIKHYDCKTLVIAPKNVALYTWPEELDLWAPGIPYSVIMGTPKQRALAVSHNVKTHIISYSNLVWLIKKHKWVWDFVILDEISFMKSTDSTRFRAFKSIRKCIGKVVGFSATPAANNIGALFSQQFCLDGGVLFGKTVGGFRDRYMKNEGYGYDKWVPRKGARKQIINKIKPSLLSVRAEEHLDQLPGVSHINHYFTMTNTTEYDEMERDNTISNLDILAGSGGVKSLKLRQLASGFVYAKDQETHILGEDKLAAFDDLYQTIKHHQVLVFYQFRAEYDLLMARYDCVSLDDGGKDFWNAGCAPILAVHPQSAGHGLNLQLSHANQVIWFTLPWDLEHYIQGIGRLRRSGNESVTIVSHRIIAANTIENRVHSVLSKRLKEHKSFMAQ